MPLGWTSHEIIPTKSPLGSALFLTPLCIIIYPLPCDPRETGVEQLSYVTSPAFKPWEVKELNSRLQLDLAVLQQHPEVRT